MTLEELRKPLFEYEPETPSAHPNTMYVSFMGSIPIIRELPYGWGVFGDDHWKNIPEGFREVYRKDSLRMYVRHQGDFTQIIWGVDADPVVWCYSFEVSPQTWQEIATAFEL